MVSGKPPLQPGAAITRRDFVNAALLGTGAALLSAPAPAAIRRNSGWNGYTGVGDYARSNGNTAEVVSAAHGIRDGEYESRLESAELVDELYDLIVVGSGFAGLSAALEFQDSRPSGKCLILENHAVFGGEAKQNEFQVDGYRLFGPQGSNDFGMPREPRGPLYELWQRLGLPGGFQFRQPRASQSGLKIARDNFGPMFWAEGGATVGYYFDRAQFGAGSGWVRDIWSDKLARAPISDSLRHELLAWRYAEVSADARADRLLDQVTYAEFLKKQLGVGPQACRYFDPIIAVADYAASSDVISAYAAKLLSMPGVNPVSATAAPTGSEILSFPGGNTTILRHYIKALMPQAIRGSTRLVDVAYAPIEFSQLDQPQQRCRIRLESTVVSVKHEGSPDSAQFVSVIYNKGGRLYRVRSRAVVVSVGGWVARHIVRDMPQAHVEAFSQFHHGPVLVANVAVRHWRFLERLGISAARWFNGFGFFCNLRAPMLINGREPELDPNKPTVLTLYVGFPQPGVPLKEQTAAARARLLATSYAEYERQICAQLAEMFGPYGLDVRHDIAGIILNRWGHAFICPQPGFYFSQDGRSAPLEVVKQGYGRIAFGHSEHAGRQAWTIAAVQGRRAARQVLAAI